MISYPMPWLTRVLDKAINDDIEVRLCRHVEPDDDDDFLIIKRLLSPKNLT